jgi:Fe-S cluster assembly protein SufD
VSDLERARDHSSARAVSDLERARDHYAARAEAFEARRADDATWLRALRGEATRSFREQGLPTTKQEEWRYTNLAPLAKDLLELSEPCAPSREGVEEISFPVYACGLYVFVDGRYAPELSTPRAISGATRVESLALLRDEAPERLEPHLGRIASLKGHPFAALNTAFLDDGAVLFVPADARLEQPVHLVFVSTGERQPGARHPRVLVVAEPGSHAVVIQDHVSLGETEGLTNAVTEVAVLRGASVDLVLIQRESGGSFHLSNVCVRQERDARFSAHTLTLGGRLVRNDLQALLADEGADCTLRGLFVGSDDQVLDNHTLVDHAMPRGTSFELYKGILGGSARGVFRGRVIVRPDAQHTSARQSNPNLLVGDGAEIDSKPQLEIHADDVKCSHGSSIGQIDPEALFYLRSRAIDEALARELLTRGFAAEVLASLPVPALAEGLDGLLQDRLAAAGRRQEAP